MGQPWSRLTGANETAPFTNRNTGAIRAKAVPIAEWRYDVKCTSIELATYEVAGYIAPGLDYKIKYSRVHPSSLRVTQMETFEIKEVAKKPKAVLTEEMKVKRTYSNGLTFYRKAHVRKIPCDQLKAMPRHKERSMRDKTRRSFVIRKLHLLGGWVRKGSNKDRYYVEPGSQLPQRLQPAKKQEFEL
uniref:Uncharacterized protein n=1 Tax=Romanomermis culicivorax TaxID=13658 RepID=A0A915JKY9_ROMCU